MIASRTNHDEPASSEPNSIAPFAVDVSRWEIDLRNLRSGERIDFATPSFDDEPQAAPSSPETSQARLAGPRPSRVARHVFGAVAATLLLGGLAFAALRGRPMLSRAAASSTNARAAVAAQAPAAPVTPAAAPAPAPAPAAVAPESPATPAALSAAELPNAKGKAGKGKGRRFTKRAK